MSAAAPTTANKPASAAPRNPATVTSAADGSPSRLSTASDAPQTPTAARALTPTAARALTPRGGYYLNRSTGRVVSWAELKDMEREGEGDMTYFCAVM